MSIKDVFPYCVFLSLWKRFDRRSALLPRLKRAGLGHAEWFEAIDANLMGGDSRGFVNVRKRSVALGKRLVLREAGQRKASSVLFLEDDVVFHPEFVKRLAALELPDDWGLFYFGCQHLEPPEPVSPGVVRVRRAYDNHAVAIRGDYFLTVRKAMRGGGKGACGRLHSDVLLSRLHGKIPTYAALPNLAWQASNHSDLTGTWYSNYNQSNGKQKTCRHLLPILEGISAHHPIYRIGLGHAGSRKAAESWKGFPIIDVGAKQEICAANASSRDSALSLAHASALRLFLDSTATHCVVIEDKVVLQHQAWLAYKDFDYFLPFSGTPGVAPGRNFRVLPGVLPVTGRHAYLASRRFAETCIPLFENGGFANKINIEVSRGFYVGSYGKDAVICDLAGGPVLTDNDRLVTPRRDEVLQKRVFVAGKEITRGAARGVSFCTLCKGRRHQLEMTLRENLKQIEGRDAELVLVDYQSADGLAEWVAAEFSIEISQGTLQFFQLQSELPFSIPVGKNFAHRLAGKDILISLDADNFIGPLWEAAQEMGLKEFIACEVFGKGMFGRIGMWRQALEDLGGYDESFEPSGHHDLDLCKRAAARGWRKFSVPCSIQNTVQHGKEETLKFLGGGGYAEWKAMEKRNHMRSLNNLRLGRLQANRQGISSAIFQRNFSDEITLLPNRFYHRNIL